MRSDLSKLRREISFGVISAGVAVLALALALPASLSGQSELIFKAIPLAGAMRF